MQNWLSQKLHLLLTSLATTHWVLVITCSATEAGKCSGSQPYQLVMTRRTGCTQLVLVYWLEAWQRENLLQSTSLEKSLQSQRVSNQSVTRHSRHNRSIQRRVFPGSRLHTYWEPSSQHLRVHTQSHARRVRQINWSESWKNQGKTHTKLKPKPTGPSLPVRTTHMSVITTVHITIPMISIILQTIITAQTDQSRFNCHYVTYAYTQL